MFAVLNVRRRITAPTLAFFALLVVLSFWRRSSTPSRSSKEWLVKVAQRRLQILQADYDAERDKRDWDLDIGDISLDAYMRDLRKSWTTVFGEDVHDSSWYAPWRSFSTAEHPVPLESVMSRMHLDAPLRRESIPHKVYTTSNLPPEDYPSQFRYWAENDESLTFRHLNDTLMNKYLSTIYPPPSPMASLLAAFPKPVLKADLLRYTLQLHAGGIYTDVDTAAVRPFAEWGQDHRDISDHVLSALPIYLHGDLAAVDDLPPPAIIVAIEMDGTDDKWRDKKMARGLQIVQWTLAAQPGHPIFLDVISRVLGKWQHAVNTHTTFEHVNPLQWTGPGPFTDAVFRYLLARHGIHPRQFEGLDVPVRVGDVLILPNRAFQADASEGPQPDHVCVWHGFLGSWRGEGD